MRPLQRQITAGYDKNGNILGLKRYGRFSADIYELIDNLSITLGGNRRSVYSGMEQRLCF